MSVDFRRFNTVEALCCFVAVLTLDAALFGQVLTSPAATTTLPRVGSLSAGHKNPASGPTLLFRASSNDAISVTSYELEVFEAGANPDTSSPVESLNLGKPPIVEGEIAVRLCDALTTLPAGDYFLTVTAIGPSGRARSGPSDRFNWSHKPRCGRRTVPKTKQ